MLESKVIIITGAAGRIGSSAAIELAKMGAKVALADISQDNLEVIKNKILKYTHKSNLLVSKTNITSESDIDNLILKTKNRFSKITAAVHCAYPRSEQWGTNYENLSYELLSKDLSAQLGGSIIFSKKILNYFVKEKGGHLIHISSIQGISSPKFEHYRDTNMTSPLEYAAIKAGIISITKWLAKYHKNQNIRVNCVSPGGIADFQPSSFVKNYRESCTNIGLLDSVEVANTIKFLLSDQSKAINGQNIIVDDGWSL